MPATVVLSASRLIPSVNRAPVAAPRALVIAIQPGVSALFTPAGVRIPGIGHQVRSVVSPPIRISGGFPPARLRTSWTNTGLIAFGSAPA